MAFLSELLLKCEQCRLDEGWRELSNTESDASTVNDEGASGSEATAQASMAFTYQNPILMHPPIKHPHRGTNRTAVAGPPSSSSYSNNEITDYSIVAFLPVGIILTIIFGIFVMYHVKRWRHTRKQFEQLAQVYDVLEGINDRPLSKPTSGEPFVAASNGNGAAYGGSSNNSSTQASPSHRIAKIISLSSTGDAVRSPFYQPTAKLKSLRFDKMHRPTTASDVILHFARVSENSDRTALVHAV